MSLTWALVLSCLCTYVLVVAISRLTIASGQTFIYCVRQRFGSTLAILMIVGLMATVVPSVMGVMGIATDVVRQWTRQLSGREGLSPILSASIFTGILYFLFWSGSHGFSGEPWLPLLCWAWPLFIATMFLVIPSPSELLADLKPSMPHTGNSHLVLAAMIGTTMASVCVVTRTYLVSEEGLELERSET